MFTARGWVWEKTPFRRLEEAHRVEEEVRDRVTSAWVDCPTWYRNLRPDEERRYFLHLKNWHTGRDACVYYVEDVEDAIEYLGPLDPDKPREKQNPRREKSFWC